MEARQRAGDILLHRVRTRQVLDLAAGLSPRGLQQTTAYPAMRYVEVDLPILERVKRATLERIGTTALGNRYFLEGGSALDPAVVERAARHLDPAKPVSVFTEGFLHYLDNDERSQAIQNITDVLRRFGGYLITDLPHHPSADPARAPHSFIRAGTQRDVSGLAFADLPAALGFCAERGLMEVDRQNYADLPLQSTADYNLDPQNVERQLRPWGMHVFELKSNF